MYIRLLIPTMHFEIYNLRCLQSFSYDVSSSTQTSSHFLCAVVAVFLGGNLSSPCNCHIPPCLASITWPNTSKPLQDERKKPCTTPRQSSHSFPPQRILYYTPLLQKYHSSLTFISISGAWRTTGPHVRTAVITHGRFNYRTKSFPRPHGKRMGNEGPRALIRLREGDSAHTRTKCAGARGRV